MRKRKQIDKNKVWEVLKSIPDPELGISVFEMGLIYDVKIEKSLVTVEMTLTTIGCPLFSLIADPIKTSLLKLPGVEKVKVELTFDPPWTPEKMSREAKIALGFV